MVDAALGATGRLDALVLNAAVSAAGPIDTEPIEDFDRMIAINLRGVVLGVRASLPALRAAGRAAASSSPPRCPDSAATRSCGRTTRPRAAS